MNEIVTKPPNKKHYINNEDFCFALMEYKRKVAEAKKEQKPKPIIPNYIGECFLKIADGLSHKYNFANYPFREEMVSDAVENCMMYFENFDPEISKNAFSYFTQISYYAFLRRIKKEKKHLYTKFKYAEQFGATSLGEDSDEPGSGNNFQLYDNISEFIEAFEASNMPAQKKGKRKKDIELEEE